MNNEQQEDKYTKFDWYEEIDMLSPLTQGDIVFDFPIATLEESDAYPFFKSVGVKYDVVVMTQACDLDQKKVDEITFCVIEPLEIIVKEIMLTEARNSAIKGGKDPQSILDENLINFASLSNGQKNKVAEILKKMKQGNYLDYYLLNKNSIGSNGTNLEADFKLVLLRQTYRVPIESAKKIIAHLAGKEDQKTRLRLLPPYREHLSQTYANTFSRIGLPIDVNKTEMDEDILKKLISLQTSVVKEE